ncbi:MULTISPECIES: hypothetical protein [unclassified Lebetimonas]|uniref:hypothetical protein n=1 Tax=unclassified Lebetimonas TaxID=2648158 RepID=UPI00046579E5|nr:MULTISPECIES: hypothetical protein [unclassified Lebetimonas]
MKEFFNVFKILFAVDVGIIVFCFLENNLLWLYNTQIAFFSTSLIILGSFLGYAGMVKHNLQNGNVGEDILKKYEDPHNMDDEEEIEVKKYKKNRLKWYEAILLNFKGGMNIIRILGYVFLVAGFLYLSKSNRFDVLSFLFGLSVVPAVTFAYLIFYKKKFNN